ncbi:hypothetical protein [Segniliparus rugosus]|uniref:Uncharacterized protein n=1 Tax=Segniliparus rugosus (strain ATCC BAA-974 / DSM 45345 / CCUG 50838 / CIP 108380 / JCM 13579 / CDC 945) TaxID=679197 RepID=E5XSG9_SEGRC|nr:hypothetical protein [Segniliparus rugosus]EFV12705.1 hypothetical protein HMPREF9336_02441 [Segniliparus rugosus ATCC BAA-974]
MHLPVSTSPQDQFAPQTRRPALLPGPSGEQSERIAARKRVRAFNPNRTLWNRRLPVSAQKAALRLANRRRCLVVDILRQGITLGLTSREMRDFAALITGERDTRMGPLYG